MLSVQGVVSEVYVGLVLYIFAPRITRSRPLRLQRQLHLDFTPDSTTTLSKHRKTHHGYSTIQFIHLTDSECLLLTDLLTAFRVAAFKAEILCCLVPCTIATTEYTQADDPPKDTYIVVQTNKF